MAAVWLPKPCWTLPGFLDECSPYLLGAAARKLASIGWLHTYNAGCTLRPAGPCELINDHDNFREGQLDSFTIDQLPDVGPIEQASGWLEQYNSWCLSSNSTSRGRRGEGEAWPGSAAQAASDLFNTLLDVLLLQAVSLHFGSVEIFVQVVTNARIGLGRHKAALCAVPCVRT